MMIHKDTIPWYKQPLVWMIIAIPSSAVIAGFATFYLAVTTDDGLVADDYYKQGLSINRKIAREDAAKDLRLIAEIDVDTDTGFIKVKFNKGKIESYPATLLLTLKHATQQQRDKQLTLQHGIADEYVGAVADGIQEGVWHFELTSELDEKASDWRLAKRVRLEASKRIILQAE